MGCSQDFGRWVTRRVLPKARWTDTVGQVSGVAHPMGPEPPWVYWLRRGIILLAVLTLLIGAVWLVTGRGSTISDSTPVVGLPSAAATASSAASPTSTAATEQATPTDCLDSAIVVEASTDSTRYAVGETPQLTLTIGNIGDVSCLRDVGPKANELEITSGGYHVWSSDDCNASNKSKIAVLKPGEKVASSITWDGQTTQKGCPGDSKAAKQGRYDLIARNSDVKSEKAKFSLIKR